MIKDISILTSAVALLVVLTNVITEVIKGFTYEKVPTRVVAVTTAILLSVCGTCAYCAVMGIAITWYIAIASVVGGFITAYGAMYGYDNLYTEIWEAIKNVRK